MHPPAMILLDLVIPTGLMILTLNLIIQAISLLYAVILYHKNQNAKLPLHLLYRTKAEYMTITNSKKESI